MRIISILPAASYEPHDEGMSDPRPLPGDYLLDQYFKNADVTTRERAREAFAEYARVLEALGAKIAARDRDSRELRSSGTILPKPTSSP